MSKQQIARQNAPHPQRPHRLGQSRMAAVNIGPLFRRRLTAGPAVTVQTGFQPGGGVADHLTVRGHLRRVGYQLVHSFIKDRDADAADLVEIPQQSFQFFQIKYGNHLLHLNNLHKLLLLYSITSANKFKVFKTVFYISRQKNRLQ